MLIRPETPGDFAAISALNRLAFAGDDEAVLVERLRTDNQFIASLVAVDGFGEVVGHIVFSPVRIIGDANDVLVASLAPMSVVPSQQRRGIGSLLVREGVQACSSSGWKAVVVVGHRDYYSRFGFSHKAVAHLFNPFADCDAFMGLDLVAETLSRLAGRVQYPAAFDIFAR